MPDTKNYPRNEEGKKRYIADCCKTMSQEHKDWDSDRVVSACFSMWKNHWNEKTSKATVLNPKGYWEVDLFEDKI